MRAIGTVTRNASKSKYSPPSCLKHEKTAGDDRAKKCIAKYATQEMEYPGGEGGGLFD